VGGEIFPIPHAGNGKSDCRKFFVVVGSCPVHWRMFNTSLYLQDTDHTCTTSANNKKRLQTAKSPAESEIAYFYLRTTTPNNLD
jgi:hypothetical protein